MKTDLKPPHTERLPLDDASVIASPERAELQRQGAKAAARGEKASSNPMQEPPNMPTATGESTDTWRQRREAWQQGHDAQSKTPDPATPPTDSPEIEEE